VQRVQSDLQRLELRLANNGLAACRQPLLLDRLGHRGVDMRRHGLPLLLQLGLRVDTLLRKEKNSCFSIAWVCPEHVLANDRFS